MALGFLELTAERRPRSDDVLRRLEEPEPVSRAEPTRDPAVIAWHRVRDAWSAAVRAFEDGSGTTVQVDVPFDDEPVVLDGGLAGRLLDVYAGLGWEGIATVQQAITAEIPKAYRTGVKAAEPWMRAWTLFRVARNAVAVVVAQCLAQLEADVAARVTANLDDVLAKLDTVEKNLGMTTDELKIPDLPAESQAPMPPTVLYTASDAGLEKTYHAAMLELARHRDAVDALVARLTEAKDAVRRSRISDIWAHSEWSKESVRDSEQTKDAKARVAPLEALVAEAQAVLRAVQEQVAVNSPALLLLLPVMRRHWTPAQMTQRLGEIVEEVRSAVKDHRPPEGPRWISTLAGVGPGTEPIDQDVLLRLQVPKEGFERLAVRTAVDRFRSDAGFVALVVEPLWADLLDRRVPRSSYGYAVGTWYLLELGDHLMRHAISQRFRTSVLNAVRAVAGLVSLALIWLPPVSLAVRGTVLAVDLLLMAESLYGVADGYYTAGVTAGLAGAAGGANVESLTTAARYCAYRRDVLATLPAQLVLELAAIPLGEASREIRRLLLLRSYYNDLQTIAAWNPRSAGDQQ
ncbi:hypothetical protein OHB14_61745 [Streptomyces sp. NBC_01613]|uniref:hypothetical protein n=1 Tax=Streptomyces sp. NBC_01613 TaxID=2975896 RepID=UPI0038709466